MLEWCDVVVHDTDDRAALESSALFYIPSARALCLGLGLTTARINSYASAAEKGKGSVYAGRKAIDNVMKCTPVVRKSAVGFINAANLSLAAGGHTHRFVDADIVACVFRLKDATKLVDELGVTADDISKACNIGLPIVKSALERYRIQYNDAHAIWHYCHGVMSNRKDKSEILAGVVTSKESDLVRTDDRKKDRMSIKKIGEENEDDIYVYRRDDLSPAPAAGHEWARTSSPK